MKINDYTLEDEKNSLEDFLSKEGIQYNHNYVRMRKGPKPFLFRLIAFSHQLRIKLLNNSSFAPLRTPFYPLHHKDYLD